MLEGVGGRVERLVDDCIVLLVAFYDAFRRRAVNDCRAAGRVDVVFKNVRVQVALLFCYKMFKFLDLNPFEFNLFLAFFKSYNVKTTIKFQHTQKKSN